MNGQPVYFHKDRDTLYVALPRELWRSAGPCDCAHCKGKEGFWDTVAVSPSKAYTWTVHAPELHSAAKPSHHGFIPAGR